MEILVSLRQRLIEYRIQVVDLKVNTLSCSYDVIGVGMAVIHYTGHSIPLWMWLWFGSELLLATGSLMSAKTVKNKLDEAGELLADMEDSK